MSLWRCTCGHYNDGHADHKGRCLCSSTSGHACLCSQFRGVSDSPEGTDIYRDDFKPGYHLREIEKGVIGELSKIQEELEELKDAEEQKVKVMQLVEASDLVGALVRWLEAKHPGTTLDDLIAMHKVTRRAFDNGRR